MIKRDKYFKITIYLFGIILSFFTAIFLQNMAVVKFFNPDIDNYYLLYDACSFSLRCSVEPFFWVIAEAGHQFQFDYSFLYFVYPFLTCSIIFITAMSWKGVGIFARLAFCFIWFAAFGALHTLVQIRFGLACALAVLAVTSGYQLRAKTIILLFGISSHFSALLTLLALVPRSLTDRRVSLIINLASLFVISAIKTGELFNILPRFLAARILTYSTQNAETLSLVSQWVSFSLYLYLTVCVVGRRLPPVFGLAAIGFIPYFIAPDLEILVRIGVPFQLILLASVCQNMKTHLNFLYPLIIFFTYKIYSNVSYIFYLGGG